MPNWCEGTLKIRGTKDNIIKFAEECIVNGKGELKVVYDEELNFLTIKDTMSTYIEHTRRMFVNQKEIEWWFNDNEEIQIVLLDIEQAWCIDKDNLKYLSQLYNLDFRIYAFEQGMSFNVEIEVINGEVTLYKEYTFNDYAWECINPKLGG
jgi:hypothetical protein